MHVEFLVEEESTAAALETLLPQLLRSDTTSKVVRFQGKLDLLAKLPSRLKGYAALNIPDNRIVILVDRDDQDCRRLKARLERICRSQGLVTRARRPQDYLAATCLAIEELEAWFFGDIPALALAYPGVSPHLHAKAPFRDPDAIAGGTWEALQRVLQKAGYHRGGLRKIAAARDIAERMNVSKNRSRSFNHFAEVVRAL